MVPIEEAWNEFLITFGRIATITMLIPVVVALFFKPLWNKALRVAFLYVLFSFLINALDHALIWAINNYTDFFRPALTYWKIDNTFFFTILYYLKDFILLGWFYSLIYPHPQQQKYIFRLAMLLAFMVTINYCFIEGYQVFGVFNPGADALFCVIIPLIYLWSSRQQSLRIPLKKNPYLWISLGILLPSMLSLFLYFSGNYIYESDFILYVKVYSIKNFFEIIGQQLIAIGFFHARYTRFITPDFP